MGLFGWIKKDTNQQRRRESAPPAASNITSSSSANANAVSAARDEAYVEALNKFNQYRAKQRLERISEGCPLRSASDHRIPSVIVEEKESDGGAQSDFSSDVGINSDERRVLNRKFDLPKSPRYSRHRQDTAAPKKPKRSVEFYRNINRIPENGEPSLNNGKNNNMDDRYSLPAMMPTLPRKSKSRLSKSNNNTIYENEVEEFEQMHVQANLGDTYAVQSPPSLFFKQNSSPYLKTHPTIVDATPKKQVNLLQKRCRNFKDKPAPQPPVPQQSETSHKKQHNRVNESDNESPFAGSYRQYEINSSSIYDEHRISSRAYRGDMKTLNSSVKSPTIKERRKSPSYQTIINKHGDLVDYALPFSDANDTNSELNSTKNGDLLNDIRACEEVINENFRFLNSDIQPSSLLIDDSTGLITEPISVLKERAPQIVTDLDNSLNKEEPELGGQLEEVDLVIHEPQDIFLELDSLEKWSKSIQISDDFLQTQFAEKNMLEFFQQASRHLLICWPKEVHYRVGTLRSSFTAPLEFSSGMFRNAPVTLRKYSLNFERNLYFAEEACKKDFEIVNHIKHYSIASLMAICFDSGLNQATLVLEPFDFTLFDYIHKMNKRLSLLHAITVVQQISSAVSFLQECGYIHSNISSGCILMRRHPYAAKLTSFELTTEASDTIRKEIENRYGSTSSSRNSMTSSQNEELKKITTYSRLIKNDEQFLRDKYRKLSKEISDNRKGKIGTIGDNSAYDCRASRFLPYCKEYREKFSLFYYVAPELLVPKSNFVFPSKSTDVYSLTLLLWEILNGYVPFVVYSRQELEKLQLSANLQLPMFEKERCDRFRQVFETGLADLSRRQMTIADILDTLDCLLLEQGIDKTTHNNAFSEDYEEQMNSSQIRMKNELNDKRKQTVPEKTDKIYFQSNTSGSVNVDVNSKKVSREATLIDVDEPAPQRTKQQPKKPARKINKAKMQQKDPSDNPKSTKKSPLSSGLSNSAIYQTIFDFNNKFLSPRSSKQIIYERTSTAKKPKSSLRSNKITAKELFETIDSSDMTGSTHKVSSGDSKENTTLREQAPEVIGPLEVHTKDSPAKMNVNSGNEKFLKEMCLEKTPECDRTKEIQPVETSKSCDSSPGTKRKNYSRLSNSLRFTIGDFTLPDTPIARKNKIRKHAWLSDQKLVLTDDNTSTPVTPQGRRTCVFFNDLGSRISRDGYSSGGLRSKPHNLNISSSMQEIKPQRLNISVNIIKSSDFGGKVKSHSQEFNKTAPAIVDIDIDGETDSHETSKKAESTDNIFEGSRWKKEKQICERTQLHHSADNLDNDGQSDTSDKVITAHLTSVRDTVRKIETTFEHTGFDYSPIRKHDSAKKSSDDKKTCDESVVVEENLLVPTKILELERTLEQLPPNEEPNSTATRLDVVLTNNTIKKKEELLLQQQSQARLPLPDASVFNPNSQLFMRRKATTNGSVIHQRTVYRESIVSSTDLPGLDVINSSQSSCTTPLPPGSGRKKKLTTRVTVNMRKISRRASDIGGSPAPSRPSSLNLDDELPSSGCLTPTNAAAATSAPIRHSCGNDLLKAFATLRLVPSSEEVGGSRCSSRNDDLRSLCTPGKAPAGGGGNTGASRNAVERFVCCNCGSSMVPVDSLNVPTGSRIGMSAAFSELNFPRESLASMFEDNLGLISQQQQLPRGTLTTIPNAKSTEDLYIDDDFYQGLNLGANMELVEFVDDGHYLDEFGYDIYATEEIYDDSEEVLEEGRDGNNAGEAPALLPPIEGDEAGTAPGEEQFLSKCADMNTSNVDAFGSVFSPNLVAKETGNDQDMPKDEQNFDQPSIR